VTIFSPLAVRALAIGVIRRDDDCILVFEGQDTLLGKTFYRPLGGGIEFGELGHQALVREIHEEVGVAISVVRQLGTLESIFTYQGRPGHEIVLAYEARFEAEGLYSQDTWQGRQDDGSPLCVLWKALAAFREGRALLYPDGLLALIDSNQS
jgi:ADP-ribose pyrophosphatase YjhB (NUDIX family)